MVGPEGGKPSSVIRFLTEMVSLAATEAAMISASQLDRAMTGWPLEPQLMRAWRHMMAHPDVDLRRAQSESEAAWGSVGSGS